MLHSLNFFRQHHNIAFLFCLSAGFTGYLFYSQITKGLLLLTEEMPLEDWSK